ncbi:MAG: phage virion morphogenesis protein [Candidatus Sedimenticola sp. 6PFRAG7]
MTGAAINIGHRFDDRDVLDALNRLLMAGRDLQPVFADFGAYLEQSHTERWDDQIAPDGAPWQALDPAYQARKKKNADKILVLEGFLRDLLAYNASSNGLEFGTNRIQGASHHFGDPARGIPERPFLGLSSPDEAELAYILQQHLLDAMRP